MCCPENQMAQIILLLCATLPFQILSDHYDVCWPGHELWTHYLLVTHMPCNAKITILVKLWLKVKGISTIWKKGKTKGVVKLLNVSYGQGLEYITPIMEICTPLVFQMSYFAILLPHLFWCFVIGGKIFVIKVIELWMSHCKDLQHISEGG